MKIRGGFVSNSSTVSFYCEICGETYEVDSRGGGPTTPEEWEAEGFEQPTDGICDTCERDYALCNKCHEPRKINDTIRTFYDEWSTDNYWYSTDRTCINCLLEQDKFDEIVNEAEISHEELMNIIIRSKPFYDLLERMNDPAYELTDTDKKLLEIINKEPEAKPKTTQESKALSMTIAQIHQMSSASKRLAIKIIQKLLGKGIKLDYLLPTEAQFMSADGIGHIEFDRNQTVKEVIDQIRAAVGINEDILRIYSLLDENV